MKSVLYIEDDAINALIVRKLLQKDFSVVLATNEDTCLAALDKQRFDLILSDINLGENSINGIELMSKIRQHANGKGTKILAVTAFAQPEDRAKFLNAGFDGYVVKPIDPLELLNAISNSVG
jgi:two-component system, cell cycle response regulator DivK